jgi:hypothetical protein
MDVWILFYPGFFELFKFWLVQGIKELSLHGRNKSANLFSFNFELFEFEVGVESIFLDFKGVSLVFREVGQEVSFYSLGGKGLVKSDQDIQVRSNCMGG